MADRPDRSRAWGVLAVTLALMALVAALSSVTSHRTVGPTAASAAHRRAASSTEAAQERAGSASSSPDDGRRSHGRGPATSDPSSGREDGSRPPRSPTGASLAARNGQETNGAVPSLVDGSAQPLEPGAELGTTIGGAEPTSQDAAPSSIPVVRDPATPATATTATPQPQTGAVATDSSDQRTPSGASTRSGTIGTTATAAFTASGGGLVTAQATWSGASAMELSISCPDGVSATRTGASGVSVEVDDTHGTSTCTVTLALPPGESGPVEYTVTVEPAA